MKSRSRVIWDIRLLMTASDCRCGASNSRHKRVSLAGRTRCMSPMTAWGLLDPAGVVQSSSTSASGNSLTSDSVRGNADSSEAAAW